jgi:phage pi2 protein 07
MPVKLSDIKNKTKVSRQYDTLKEFPMSMRQYLSSGAARFDKKYFNRGTADQLRFMFSARYNVDDRDFGGTNLEIANIYLNMLNSPEVNKLIEIYLFNKFWVFHPVRKFEKWNTLSNIYYNDENYYWMILVFNRIVDPFKDLLDFNIVRIPNFSFLNDLPTEFTYRFTGGDFEIKV